MPLFDQLYNFARWWTQNREEAEDLVQETYAKALKGFSSFQLGTNFRAWMYRILRNTFLTSRTGLRAALTVPLDSEDDGPEPGVENKTPETILMRPFNSQLVQSAIDNLPVHYREALLLCEVEEMSYQEIAETLSIPIGAVMSRLSRARCTLRVHLGKKLQAMNRWRKVQEESTMVCESWKAKLDQYLDGELSEQEMRTFDAHVRSCPSCSVDALARVQTKRAIQVAGKRFTPGAEFRKRVQQSIASKPRRSLRLGWMFVAAMAVILAVWALTSTYVGTRGRDQAFSEIADLHVATLASSSPVDVISTDRHTVKPWFQGKIPFAFDLPELQSTEFSLFGGRMTYLGQTPGAHLIYDVRKHHISVFVFQERSLPAKLDENSLAPKVSFNVETWSQGGLRYFVIGDASAVDIDSLAKLFKTAASQI